jgi:hypothetical protein
MREEKGKREREKSFLNLFPTLSSLTLPSAFPSLFPYSG